MRDPDYAAWSRQGAKRGLAFHMVGAMVGGAMIKYIVDRGGEYASRLLGEDVAPDRTELTDDPNHLTDINLGSGYSITNPALGTMKMAAGLTQDIFDSQGRPKVQPMDIFRRLTVNQLQGPGKAALELLIEKGKSLSGPTPLNSVTDSQSAQTFVGDIGRRLIQHTIGQPAEEIFGVSSDHTAFGNTVPTHERLGALFGVHIKHQELTKKAVTQMKREVNQQWDVHRPKVDTLVKEYQTAYKTDNPEVLSKATKSLLAYINKEHEFIGRMPKSLKGAFPGGKIRFSEDRIRNILTKAGSEIGFTLQNLPDELKAGLPEAVFQREGFDRLKRLVPDG